MVEYAMAVGHSHINIEASRDQYCMSCEVHLSGQDYYSQVEILDDLDITVGGVAYEFFVESKKRTRKHGSTDYVITGLSKSALLDAPYSSPITEEFSGLASTIVRGLASGYTVNWNTVDWVIPPDTLLPADQTPLQIIRDIVKAVGAIIQTEPNGEITIEPAYPITLNPAVSFNWYGVTPDYILSDAFNFFSTNEDYEHKPGYNRFVIGDELTEESNITIEEESLTKATKRVRVYQVPWQDNFIFNHTGGDWVSYESEGIENRIIQEEIVEFVNGVGQTAFPIYFHNSPLDDWLEADLGVIISFDEDGTLRSTIEGESLLKITYSTRCRMYYVVDFEDEQVQLTVDEPDEV